MLVALCPLFLLWIASGFALFATHAVVKGKWFAAPLWLLGYFVAATITIQVSLGILCPYEYYELQGDFLHGVVMALYLGGAFSTIVVAICAFVLRRKLLQE